MPKHYVITTEIDNSPDLLIISEITDGKYKPLATVKDQRAKDILGLIESVIEDQDALLKAVHEEIDRQFETEKGE